MLATKNVVDIDEAVLADPTIERRDPFGVSMNATGYLANVLAADAETNDGPLAREVQALMEYWEEDPSTRPQAPAGSAATNLHLFGIVGHALFLLRSSGASPQLARELRRFANEPTAWIGNHFLFYVAGAFAKQGFDVTFVPERAGKTPDLMVSKDKRSLYVEATAKQPLVKTDTPESVRRLIRDAIGEKAAKFRDERFAPGVIAVDISTVDHRVSENGTEPFLKLRPETCQSLPGGRFISRLSEDPEFATRPENQGNVFAFLLEEFRAIDRRKHHVTQCLVTFTRTVVHLGDRIVFPKGHQLIVAPDAETDAVTELATHTYVCEQTGDYQ